MPTRGRGRDRQGELRRELLRTLLEQEDPEEVAPEDVAALVRELRRSRRQRALIPPEQLQGFIWGVGAAALLLLVLPSAKKSLRPFAVMAVKGAMELADQVKTLLGEAGEGLQDIVAEAQFERLREAAGPAGADPK